MTRPAGKVANRKVNITGRNSITLACTGSAGCGLSLVCRNMVMPISSGQTPIIRKAGGAKGSRPNRLKIEVGSGAARSWIQPKKGAWRISMVT